MIIRFVRAVFTVGENGGAEIVPHVREIDPLVRSDFEFLRVSCGTLDGTDVPVIGSHLIGGGEWECCFQI